MMKVVISGVLCGILLLWLLCNSVSFFVGSMDSPYPSCNSRLSRLNTYIFPAYKLGCYMGQPAESDK
jgi:hypothetical protein